MESRFAPADAAYWKPVSTGGLVALLACSGWLFMLLLTDKDGFIQVLDSSNLAIHEFGHPLFGVFGEYIGFWGGTLMELIVPLVIVVAFVRERAALSVAVAGVWFFENFLYIAHYMADARAQELPLVGGGEHDWAYILGHAGLLQSDTAIAHVVSTIGWVGMIASLVFAAAVWLVQRQEQPAAVSPPDSATSRTR